MTELEEALKEYRKAHIAVFYAQQKESADRAVVRQIETQLASAKKQLDLSEDAAQDARNDRADCLQVLNGIIERLEQNSPL